MYMDKLLRENRVIDDLGAIGKDEAMDRLAEVLALDLTDIGPHGILEGLWERERLGTTGIGHGIAIPHAKLMGVGSPIAVLARSREGIDFDAMDGAKVHIIVALASPEKNPTQHLMALSTISRLLKSRRKAALLMEAENAVELYREAVREGDD